MTPSRTTDGLLNMMLDFLYNDIILQWVFVRLERPGDFAARSQHLPEAFASNHVRRVRTGFARFSMMSSAG